jgi:hypothetical protein
MRSCNMLSLYSSSAMEGSLPDDRLVKASRHYIIKCDTFCLISLFSVMPTALIIATTLPQS